MQIDNVFVINLKHRQDRWNKIQDDFKNTQLRLKKWDGIYGKNLTEEQIKDLTNSYCYNFCSTGMMGCWLSHYSLWQYIVKNKLNNTLILEDDAVPVQDFNQKLNKFLKTSAEYDIIYLGCDGSCDNKNNYFGESFFGKNNDLYINGNKIDNMIVPAFPLGMHAYIISYNGAKKLIEHDKLKKIGFHIDYYLAKHIFNNPDESFKMYSTNEPFIVQRAEDNISDIVDNEHPLFNFIFSKIKFTNSHNMDYIMNTKIFYIRKLDVSVNWYFVIFMVLSFIIGLMGNNEIIKYYIYALILIYLIEASIKKNISSSNMLTEILIIIIFLYLGKQLRFIYTNK